MKAVIGEVAVVCKLIVFVSGSASRKVCFRVERANVFLSADARNLMSPSLPQSFEFHARTDLAHRFAREKITIFGNIIHFVRSGGTQVILSLGRCCIRLGERRKNITHLLPLETPTFQGRARSDSNCRRGVCNVDIKFH